MRVAFIVLAHKSPAQVIRFISHLVSHSSVVLLHVDRIMPKDDFYEIKNFANHHENVILLKRNFSNWGSIGLVRASLAGLALAEEAGCKYAILLSGQDYPIKPLSSFMEYLENADGASFMEYKKLPQQAWIENHENRYKKWHINLGVRDSKFRTFLNKGLSSLMNVLQPERKFPESFLPFGGAQWWCLHEESIKYILKSFNDNHNLYRFFKFVSIPDEMYFHTVLLNSRLRDTITNKSLTYIDWEGPPFPRILDQSDYDNLLQTDLFFARKFDTEIDEQILDRLDSEILEKANKL